VIKAAFDLMFETFLRCFRRRASSSTSEFHQQLSLNETLRISNGWKILGHQTRSGHRQKK
jgi:hypothetical protein